MKTLLFQTNIDSSFQLHKAACGFSCLHGRYCRLRVDLFDANHLLTVDTDSLSPDEIVNALQQVGVWCETQNEAIL